MPQDGSCLVTGAAGFIGSHLCERLLDEGHRVVGLDAFTAFYPPSQKRRNLAPLLARPGFRLVEGDLCQLDLEPLLEGVHYIFHQAGQAGVRTSWGREFEVYLRANVLATQRLLEAARAARALRRFIYASSSSVYGDVTVLPLHEATLPRPTSPYGVTKLAGEQLAGLYADVFHVPTISLRYFTAYGPRQRPDMAFHRFLRALYADEPITLFGDGEQTRDFTYVSDVVQANLLAMTRGAPGAVYNIGGGARVTLNACLALLARITARPPRLVYREAQPGDMRHTYADITRAQAHLGYAPGVPLAQGLAAEDAWFRATQLGAAKQEEEGRHD